MAAIALALTPLQVVAGWFAVRPLLREQSEGGRKLRRIDDILETRQLDVAFQPIVDLTSGRVTGVEALARFISDPQQPPDRWFADADSVDRGLRLELLAVETALRQAMLLPDHPYVAIDVSPRP